MARGRKNTYIRTHTSRDMKLLDQLARTGVCTEQQALKYCKLTTDRLSRLKNSDYIKVENKILNGQSVPIVKLSDFGQKWYRENFKVISYPHIQDGQLPHDLKHTEMYYRLIPDEAKHSWINENIVIQNIYARDPSKRGHLTTCVDAVVRVPISYFRTLQSSKNFRTFGDRDDYERISSTNGGYVDIAVESRGSSYTDEIMEEKYEIAEEYGCSGMLAI